MHNRLYVVGFIVPKALKNLVERSFKARRKKASFQNSGWMGVTKWRPIVRLLEGYMSYGNVGDQ